MNLVEEKKTKQAKQKFINWIQDSSLHGFPKIFKTDISILKIIWIIFIGLSISGCCFFIFNTVNNFLKFEVTTVIRRKPQNPIKLPAFSICHKDFFLTHNGHDFLQKFMQDLNMTDIFNSTFLFNMTQIMDEALYMEIFAYISRSSAMDRNLSNDKKKSLGFNLNSNLISCIYISRPCNISHEFVHYFEKYYGNCYLFNSEMTNSQTNVAYYYGFQMEFLERSLDQTNKMSSSKGIHITLFDSKRKENAFRGIDLPVKYETNIVVSKKVIKKLPKPYSDCLEDHSEFYSSDVYQATVELARSYSQSDCFDVCYQKSLINTCNCYDPNFAFFKNAKVCSDLMELHCMFNHFSNFYSQSDVKEKCTNCPLECTKTEYEYKLSYSDYPTDTRARGLVQMLNKKQPDKNYTLDYVKENSLKMNIYFDSLDYEEIEELRKMEPVDLVSNIGGLLGLFIGFSLLSLVEIVEIVITISSLLWDKKNRHKVVHVQPEKTT